MLELMLVGGLHGEGESRGVTAYKLYSVSFRYVIEFRVRCDDV